MSVAESEELTRRMQQRVYQDSSEGMGEIEQAAADDIDAVIDPSLHQDTIDSTSRPVSTMRGPTPNAVVRVA